MGHQHVPGTKKPKKKLAFDGYTLLGKDLEGCDQDFAASAQAEVMLDVA